MKIVWRRDYAGRLYSYTLIVSEIDSQKIYKYVIQKVETQYGIRYRVFEFNSYAKSNIWVPNFQASGFDEINAAFKTESYAKKAIEFHEGLREMNG